MSGRSGCTGDIADVAIEFQVLGRAGRDNALWVKVDSGQAQHRLLFDCGEGCLPAVGRAELLNIDHLFLSHFHLDHVCGFDGLFRRVYNRESKPVSVWGPSGTVALMHHRFLSFWWNLHEGQGGEWVVRDVNLEGVGEGGRFFVREGFVRRHPVEQRSELVAPAILREPDYSVEALVLEHHGPSVGYLVREADRVHVRAERLAELQLPPGPWIKLLKEGSLDHEVTGRDGVRWTPAALSSELLVETPGDSIAYLTDFLLDDPARRRLIPWLNGVGTLVCESQYRHSDRELAQRNCHATARSVGRLARDAAVGKLILMHLSERYSEREWGGLLREARQAFPGAEFPPGWEIG